MQGTMGYSLDTLSNHTRERKPVWKFARWTRQFSLVHAQSTSAPLECVAVEAEGAEGKRKKQSASVRKHAFKFAESGGESAEECAAQAGAAHVLHRVAPHTERRGRSQ
eukprot:1785808-Pleurochrysis_carterae.AAC.1